jgi:hypothetical protein
MLLQLLLQLLLQYAPTRRRVLHGSYKRLRRNGTLDVRKRGSLCRTRMEGTHSTERREPNTTSICRRDCLKGGDHGQCSTPEKHATQTGGLPPVRNRTHTPNAPGQHTSEHSVEGWLKSCCDTHPPRQLQYAPTKKKKKGVTRVHPQDSLTSLAGVEDYRSVVIRPEMSPHASAVLFVSLVAET